MRMLLGFLFNPLISATNSLSLEQLLSVQLDVLLDYFLILLKCLTIFLIILRIHELSISWSGVDPPTLC